MNHGDIVREALNFGYGGDPNYRPFYEDGITALDALLADVERLTAERDEAVMKKARMDNWGYSDRGLQARAEAAEREVERLTAERDEAMASNAVFMSDEAYSRLHDAWHVEQERAEAAEALAERRLADLRTYWTHCGYPEWYGDEERAWLHAALTDAGPNATQTTERRLGMSEQTPQDEANVILRSLLARFAALQPDNTEEEQT